MELPTGDVRENESNFENKPNILNVHTPTIVWDDTANVKYEHALLHREIQESLHEIETKILIDSKNIDDQVNSLNNIMMTAAKKSLKIIKHSHRRRPRKRANHIIKLNDTCKNLKRKLLSTKRLFLKYPQEPNVRGGYFSAAKYFKREVRRQKRKIKGELIRNVEKAHNQSHTHHQFWTGVNSRIDRDKVDDTNNVSSEEWEKYFSELSTTLNPQKFNSTELKQEVLTFTSRLENDNLPHNSCLSNNQDQLMRLFEYDEVHKQITLLKLNKGTGPDSIKNEMLRCARDHITKHIVSIFNNILTTGIYPGHGRQVL